MSSSNVNLLSPAAGVSVQTVEIAGRMRQAAIIALSVFLAAGLVTVGVFYFFRLELTRVNDQERTLISQLTQFSQVEALNDVVTSRMAILSRITAKQRDWKKFLTLLESIIPSDHVATFSVDEAGSVGVKLVPLSIPEASDVVTKLTSITKNHRIGQARFDSMNLDASGNIVLTMSFNSL